MGLVSARASAKRRQPALLPGWRMTGLISTASVYEYAGLGESRAHGLFPTQTASIFGGLMRASICHSDTVRTTVLARRLRGRRRASCWRRSVGVCPPLTFAADAKLEFPASVSLGVPLPTHHAVVVLQDAGVTVPAP
jgi:hypothetical protein